MKPLRLVIGWLFDRANCPPRARWWLSASAFCAFVTLVLIAAAHHEVWRDEARALSMALEPGSWLGLGDTLANEGHPGLWHLLLRLTHGLVHTPMVLQLLALPIGIGAAALLFFLAPLPTWWRVGWLFGWVPLFEGTVLCRNYGISMLLLFAFCHLARKASPRPMLAALALALLANTNVYGTMMALGLGGFLLVEAARHRVAARVLVLIVLLVGTGIVASVWTMWPTPESKLMPSIRGQLGDSWGNAGEALRNFGREGATGGMFGFLAPGAWGIVLLTAVAAMCLPHLAVTVLTVFAGAAWFIRNIYGAGPHHLGMMFAFLTAVTWLRAGCSEAIANRLVLSRAAWQVLLFVVWPLLLLLHGYRGLREMQFEIELSKSSAPELARLLERDDLADAVLIGQPDYYLDALPYYRDNRIFIAREGRFGRRVAWTKANRREFDLGQLLTAARAVQHDQAAPVLLVIGWPIDLHQTSGAMRYGYGDWFRWTPQQHEEFRISTEHLADLPARPSRFRGDERYAVYRLR